MGLTRKQFGIFCEQINKRFQANMKERIRVKRKNLPLTDTDIKQIKAIKSWEDLINGIVKNTSAKTLENIGILLIGDVFRSLENSDNLGEPLKNILSELNKDQPSFNKITKEKFSVSVGKYIYRQYYDGYKRSEAKVIPIGDSTSQKSKSKALVFCYYIGYESLEAFKEAYPEREDTKSIEDIISSYANLFDRQDEWIDLPDEWDLSGKWRVEAQELSVYFSEEGKSTQDNLVPLKKKDKDAVNMLVANHREDIRYSDRYTYWGDVHIYPLKQKGFFWGEGTLSTNSPIELFNGWTLKFVCSLRSSKDTKYCNMEYEMFPKKGVNSPRTFGSCMFQPPIDNNIRRKFRGFYFSNRLREPDEDGESDVIFDAGLRVSMGRVMLYKPVKK